MLRDVVKLTIKRWKIEIQSVVYFSHQKLIHYNLYWWFKLKKKSQKPYLLLQLTEKSKEWYALRFVITNEDSNKIDAKLLWNVVIIQCNFIWYCSSFPFLYPIDNNNSKLLYCSWYSSPLSISTQQPHRKHDDLLPVIDVTFLNQIK